MPRHEASAAARSLRQWPLLIVIIGVLAGLAVAFVSESGWRLGCLLIGASLGVGSVPRRGEQHVLEHGHPRQRPRRLERPHEPGARDPVRRTAVDPPAVQQHAPGLRPQEARDAVEERRLARRRSARSGR